jgi:long-chain acyl-CoA synthetase
MEKIWLKNYPKNIPHEINPDSFTSLTDLFKLAVKQFGEKPALYNLGTTITYNTLEKKSRDFAAYCQQHLKLQKGDRIAIMLPNSIQYFVALFGAFLAGLTVVNINPLYTPRELEHQVNDAGTDTIIVLANFVHAVQEALSKTKLKNVIVTEIGDMFSKAKSHIVNFAVRRKGKIAPNYNAPHIIRFRELMKKGKRAKLNEVSLSGDDIAFLQYTGGTTGVSKGAILTHRNILANVEQTYAWVSPVIDSGNEIIITALPLYHIFSLLANCFLFLKAGILNVLITNANDISGLVKELSKHQFTVITGVNTLFKALLRHKNFKDLDFSKLKVALGGGMAVHKSVADHWQEVTGAALLEGYGLTECSPVVCCTPIHLKAYHGSIGLPIPSTELKVIDDAGNSLPTGEIGELCVRGPQTMRGYWNKIEETANVLCEEGWLKTGDVVRIDPEGYVYIVDRKKDLIVVSGYNVYPNEIEEVIAGHPGVLEVAVIGIDSDKTGEIIKAFVVKKESTLTKESIVDFCRDRLITYKIPRRFEFRDELPKSNVGKILRRALKEEEVL